MPPKTSPWNNIGSFKIKLRTLTQVIVLVPDSVFIAIASLGSLPGTITPLPLNIDAE